MAAVVAFIGLGAMGGPMASNLLDAGFTVRAFNRSPERACALGERGAVACDTIAEVVQGAECVVSMVSDDEATREVMLGAGATIKLVNNMLSGTLTAAIAEALSVAQAAGIDGDAALAILSEGAAGSRLVRGKIPKMLARDFSPQFQLALMEKDLRYFLALSQEVDRPAPIGALVRSQLQAARRAGLGGLDVSAIFVQSSGELVSAGNGGHANGGHGNVGGDNAGREQPAGGKPA